MTESELEHHHRRSTRLKGWDYTGDGAYFVTICTNNRENLFGEITEGVMRLNMIGKIVAECWQGIPNHFANASLGMSTVMPNHIHGVIFMAKGGARNIESQQQFSHHAPSSISAIMRSFKGAVTKRIGMMPDAPARHVWQRNYHEHIIRDDNDLDRIDRYIEGNVARWAEDEENVLKRG